MIQPDWTSSRFPKCSCDAVLPAFQLRKLGGVRWEMGESPGSPEMPTAWHGLVLLPLSSREEAGAGGNSQGLPGGSARKPDVLGKEGVCRPLLHRSPGDSRAPAPCHAGDGGTSAKTATHFSHVPSPRRMDSWPPPPRHSVHPHSQPASPAFIPLLFQGGLHAPAVFLSFSPSSWEALPIHPPPTLLTRDVERAGLPSLLPASSEHAPPLTC